jgi:hypothetical protein
MANADATRTAAAVELADAMLAEFNDANSKLRGLGTAAMEKLLVYQKLMERATRGASAKAKRSAEPDVEAQAEAEEPDPPT